MVSAVGNVSIVYDTDNGTNQHTTTITRIPLAAETAYCERATVGVAGASPYGGAEDQQVGLIGQVVHCDQCERTTVAEGRATEFGTTVVSAGEGMGDRKSGAGGEDNDSEGSKHYVSTSLGVGCESEDTRKE